MLLGCLPGLRGPILPRACSCCAGARRRAGRFGCRVCTCRRPFLPCRCRRGTTGGAGSAGARRIPAMPGLTGTRFYSTGVRNAAHSLSASRHRPSRRCWGWGLCRTYRLRSPLSRCSGSFRSGRRIRRTAGKPHCAATLLYRGALSRRWRLAAFSRSASGLPALRHGDVILFSRRYAAVCAALIDPLEETAVKRVAPAVPEEPPWSTGAPVPNRPVPAVPERIPATPTMRLVPAVPFCPSL